MNRKSMISSILLLIGIFSHPATVAFHRRWDGTSFWDGIIPYIGANAKWRHMGFKKDFGDNVVRKGYPEGELYGGVKFNEYIGIEAGYETTASRKRNVTLYDGDIYFGQPYNAIAPNNRGAFSTRTKIYGPYANLTGFLLMSEEYCLQLIGSIGLAKLKIHARATENAGLYNVTIRDFEQKKWIPKFTIGLQHMLIERFGIRTTVGWENTARFNNIRSVNVSSTLVAKTRNSINIGLGLFYYFQ